MHRTAPLLRLTTVAVAAVLLAGCTSGSAAAPATRTVTVTASATPSAAPTGNDGATSAGVDPANPPAAVASTTVPWPREKDPQQTAKVEVLGLRRTGKTLVLTAALTFTTSVTGDLSLYETTGNAVWAPELVDPVHLKLYRVVTWKGGGVASDPTNLDAPSGGRVYLWAVFAAPPPDVTTLDVHLSAGVPPFTAVPLS